VLSASILYQLWLVSPGYSAHCAHGWFSLLIMYLLGYRTKLPWWFGFSNTPLGFYFEVPIVFFVLRALSGVIRGIKDALAPRLSPRSMLGFHHKLRLALKRRVFSWPTPFIYPGGHALCVCGDRATTVIQNKEIIRIIKHSCATEFNNIMPNRVPRTTNAHEAVAVIRRRLRDAIVGTHRNLTAIPDLGLTDHIYEYQSSASQSLGQTKVCRFDVTATDRTTYPVERADDIHPNDVISIYDTAGPAGFKAMNELLSIVPSRIIVTVGESHDFTEQPTSQDWTDHNRPSVAKELNWSGDKVRLTLAQHGCCVTTYEDELTNLGFSERICVSTKLPITLQNTYNILQNTLYQQYPPNCLHNIMIHFRHFSLWGNCLSWPILNALAERSVFDPEHPGSLVVARVFDVVNHQAGGKSINFMIESYTAVGPEAEKIILDPDIPNYRPKPVKFLDTPSKLRRMFYQTFIGPTGPALCLQVHTVIGCISRITVDREVTGPLVQKGETNNWQIRPMVTAFTQAADTPGILTDSLKDTKWTKTQYETVCDFFNALRVQNASSELFSELSFAIAPTVSSCTQESSVTKEMVVLIDFGLKTTSVPMNRCDVLRSVQARLTDPSPPTPLIIERFVDADIWATYKQLSYFRAMSLVRNTPQNLLRPHHSRPISEAEMKELLLSGYDEKHFSFVKAATSTYAELLDQAQSKGAHHVNKLLATSQEDHPTSRLFTLNGQTVRIDPCTGTLPTSQFTAKAMVKGEPPSKMACSISRIVVNFNCEALTLTKEVGLCGKLLLQSEAAGTVIGHTPSQEKDMIMALASGFPTCTRVACANKVRSMPFLYKVESHSQVHPQVYPDWEPNTTKLLRYLGLQNFDNDQVDAAAGVLLVDYADGPTKRTHDLRYMSTSLLSSADFSAFDASQCDSVTNVIFQELFSSIFHTDAAMRQTLMEELLSGARIIVEAFDSEDGLKRGSFNPKILNPDGRTNGNLSGNGRTTFRNNIVNSLVSYRAIFLFLWDLREALLISTKDTGSKLLCPALALYGDRKQVQTPDINRAFCQLCPLLFPHMFLISGDDNVTCCPMKYVNLAAEEVCMKVGLECDIFRDPLDPNRQEVNFLAKKYHLSYDPVLHHVDFVCSYPIILRALRKMVTSAPHRWPGKHVGFAFISAALGRFVQTSQTGGSGPVPYMHELIMSMTAIGLSLLKKSQSAQHSDPDDLRKFIEKEAIKGSETLTVYADRNLNTQEKLGYYDRLLQTVAVWSGNEADSYQQSPLTGQRFFYSETGNLSDAGRPISFGDGSVLDSLVSLDLFSSGFDPNHLLAFTDLVRDRTSTYGMHDIPPQMIADILKAAPSCTDEMEQLMKHASQNGLSMFYTQPYVPDCNSRRIALEVVRPSSSGSVISDVTSERSSLDSATSSKGFLQLELKPNGKPYSKAEYLVKARKLDPGITNKTAKGRYDFMSNKLRTQADLVRASLSPEVTNNMLDVQSSGRGKRQPGAASPKDSRAVRGLTPRL